MFGLKSIVETLEYHTTSITGLVSLCKSLREAVTVQDALIVDLTNRIKKLERAQHQRTKVGW